MSKVELSKRAKLVLGWVKQQLMLPSPDFDESKSPSPARGRGVKGMLCLRQQTLADKFGCSRRSIYRALKQLKEQGYLVETGKRENRCKVYQIVMSSNCRSSRAHTMEASSPGPCELKLAAAQATSLVALRASQSPKAPQVSQESAAWTEEGRRHDAGPGEVKLCYLAKFYLDNCRQVFKYNFPESFDWERHFPEATHRIRHVEHQTKFWRLMFDNLYLIQERETGKPHSARTDNPDSTLFGVSYPKVPPAENLEHRMRTRPAYRPLR
ncbi:MAG: helix-turn-helix domain-containing protein [Deltaproteobacteria bacterium]|nr:helix-turn-helix domain-containing protein [Deltaproteobacteria bacterium]